MKRQVFCKKTEGGEECRKHSHMLPYVSSKTLMRCKMGCHKRKQVSLLRMPLFCACEGQHIQSFPPTPMNERVQPTTVRFFAILSAEKSETFRIVFRPIFC